MSYPVSTVVPILSKSGVIFNSFAVFIFVFQSVQVYPAVFLTHFTSAAVILVASLALMIQFPSCYFLTVEVNIFSNECFSGRVSVAISEMLYREFTNFWYFTPCRFISSY
jgi:hypothetical protein